jgi:tetratricopeptide (TPR) repeat protein
MDKPNLSSELQTILQKGSAQSLDEIHLLFDYECYHIAQPSLEKLYESEMNQEKKIEQGLLLSRLFYQDSESLDQFVTFCQNFVKENNLSFDFIKEHLLQKLIGPHCWLEKKTFIESLIPFVMIPEEKIALLEYLGFILEKKLFQEEEVTKVYGRILSIDPKHTKSLRFFKNLFFYQGQHKKALEQLDKLVKYSHHHREIQRYAHEQANLLFYHFKRPQDALIVLETYCGNNKIEIRKITTDLYLSLNKRQQLVPFLMEILYKLESFSERKIYFQKLVNLLKETNELEQGLFALLNKFQQASPDIIKLNDLSLFYETIKAEKIFSLLPYVILKLPEFAETDEDQKTVQDFLSNLSSS